ENAERLREGIGLAREFPVDVAQHALYGTVPAEVDPGIVECTARVIFFRVVEAANQSWNRRAHPRGGQGASDLFDKYFVQMRALEFTDEESGRARGADQAQSAERVLAGIVVPAALREPNQSIDPFFGTQASESFRREVRKGPAYGVHRVAREAIAQGLGPGPDLILEIEDPIGSIRIPLPRN